MESLPALFHGLLGVLLFTCFVKIATTLSILRYGIGLHDSAFGLVILAVSLALSLLVMEPHLGKGGWEELIGKPELASNSQISSTFRPFLEAHADQKLTEKLMRFAQPKEDGRREGVEEGLQKLETPISVLSSSFLLTELRSAFYVGLIILIPFLVIDLLVTNVLMVLGVTQMPHAVASLPLKLLLFFALDGWTLITEKIISGYLS